MDKESDASLLAVDATPPREGPAARYRRNVEALRSAQKPSRGTAAYSRLVNRPAARKVAAAADLVGLSPNQVTALSAALSAAGLVLLACLAPSWWLAVSVSLLLAGGYVLDSVDGQLARLRGSGSLRGEYLDHTVDCVKTCALHLAVLVSWYRFPPVDDRAWLLVPIGFELVDMVSFFGLVSMPLLRKLHGAAGPASAPSTVTPEHPWRMWVILPTDYGVFCWLFLLMAWPPLFVAGYTSLFAVNAVVLVPVLRKWWRELRDMDGIRA
jgi:phosphatidylglycerophosphate synthase